MGSISTARVNSRDAQFIRQGRELLDQIRTLEVVDLGTFEQMATLGRIGKKIASAIEDQYAPHIKAADKNHKDLLQWKKDVMEYFAKAEKESKARVLQAHEKFPQLEIPGVVFSKGWRIEIIDPQAVPRDYLMPDETKIKAVAAALGEECKIPGVRVVRNTQVSYRGE